MRETWAIFKRELGTYLLTPTAYAAMAGFLVIAGYFFSVSVLGTRMADMRGVMGNMSLVFLFIAPILTMRLLADEARQGTAELIFTSPVTITQVVVGKYLAALAVLLLLTGITFTYPAILELQGGPDWGPIWAGYLGFFLLAATFLAAGMFTSSLTDSQMVAGVLGFALLLLLWVISWAGDTLGPPLDGILRSLSVTEHFLDFRKGIIDTKHIVFYLSMIAGFLFLSVRVVESRNWR